MNSDTNVKRTLTALLILAAFFVFAPNVFAADDESLVTQQLRKALDLSPEDDSVRYQFAVALLRDKKFSEALPHLLTVAKDNPSDPDINYHLGYAYAGLGDYEKAIKAYETVEKTGRAAAKETYELDKSFYNIGISYQLKDEYVKALHAYDKSIAIDPQQGLGYCRRGEVYFNIKNYNEALENFKVCEVRFPADAQVKKNIMTARMIKGSILIDEKRYDAALAEFKKVSETDPSNEKALYFQGLLYYQLSEFRKSFAIATQLRSTENVELKNSLSTLFYNLGVEFQARKDWDSADKSIRSGLEIKKNDPDLHYLLGYNYIQKDDYQKAAPEIKETLRLDPSHAKATIALALLTDKIAAQRIKTGETELALGNYEAALAQFNEVLEMDPKNKRALKGRRDAEKAIDSKRYESLAKQEKEIKQKLAEADKLLKDKKYKDALTIYRYVLAIDASSAAATKGASVCENLISDGKLKHGGLGDKYSAEQKYGLAVKEYSLALSFDPDDTLIRSKSENAETQLQNVVTPLLDDAHNYEDKEQYVEALKSYNMVLTQDSENKDAQDGVKRIDVAIDRKYAERISTGKKAAAAGEYIKAAQNYKVALSLKPDDSTAKRELSRLQDSVKRAVAAKLKAADKALEGSDYAAAVAAYDEVLSVDDNNLQAVEGMQKVKSQLSEEITRKLSSAEDAFRNGRYYQAYNYAGEVLSIDKDNKSARSIRTESRQKMDSSVAPILKKALDDFNKKDSESAVAGFKRVLNIDPSNETAKKHLAKIDQSKVAKSVEGRIKKLYDEGIQFYLEGKYTQAIKNWEQVLELDPRHEKASANIKKAKKKMEGVMDVK